MARNKKTPGAPDLDLWEIESQAYVLPTDQMPQSELLRASASGPGSTDDSTSRPEADSSSPSPLLPNSSSPSPLLPNSSSPSPLLPNSSSPSPLLEPPPLLPNAAGTPAADTFLVHTGTLAAAVAQPPTIAEFSGYSAAQGDVIDFTAMRAVAHIAPTPDSSLLRVIEDAGGQFATFEFNFGTAGSPNWTALAKLDGVHLGDTVKVAVDATHLLELHSAWLA